MRRRHKHRQEEKELELTTFLNVLVVLISFLLVTAVFSRIAIQELRLPAGGGGGTAQDKPVVTLEVMVRKNGLEIGDGKKAIAAIPKSGDKYDIPKLSQYLQNLKEKYPEKTDATILSEADIPYEDLIVVMDAVKAARIKQPGSADAKIVLLFPDVSIGDAP